MKPETVAKKLNKRLKELYTNNNTTIQQNVGGGDIVDVSFDIATRELNTHLATNEASEVRQIEQALLRLKEGTYGICSDCQHKIKTERLEALPYCVRCIECQRKYDADK